MTRILFVCLGNICRSPMAEGWFRKVVENEGLEEEITIDSAGTSDWNIGCAPDKRAISTAALAGVDIKALRARQVSNKDFTDFDYILAMDHENLDSLRGLCPESDHDKLHLFMDFADDPAEAAVPDPYYGGAREFPRVLDMIAQASDGLMRELQQNHE